MKKLDNFKVSSGLDDFTVSCWLRPLNKKRVTQDCKSVFPILPAPSKDSHKFKEHYWFYNKRSMKTVENSTNQSRQLSATN